MTESESTKQHKKNAPASVGWGTIVISTSISLGTNTDCSGRLLKEMIESKGHSVLKQALVPDDPDRIRRAVLDMAGKSEIQAIVSSGGTGLTITDVTFETVRPLFKKELTGFLPLFMQLSFEDVGSACLLSRATAGIIDIAHLKRASVESEDDIPMSGEAVLFALPGSPKACILAMEKLILPEIAHITRHFRER